MISNTNKLVQKFGVLILTSILFPSIFYIWIIPVFFENYKTYILLIVFVLMIVGVSAYLILLTLEGSIFIRCIYGFFYWNRLCVNCSHGYIIDNTKF